MTPQERAEKIFLMRGMFLDNPQGQKLMIAKIAAEIRNAESDAYEKAAKIADSYQEREDRFVDGTTGGFQAAHAADCCVDIAEDIRALKETK